MCKVVTIRKNKNKKKPQNFLYNKALIKTIFFLISNISRNKCL